MKYIYYFIYISNCLIKDNLGKNGNSFFIIQRTESKSRPLHRVPHFSLNRGGYPSTYESFWLFIRHFVYVNYQCTGLYIIKTRRSSFFNPRSLLSPRI